MYHTLMGCEKKPLPAPDTPVHYQVSHKAACGVPLVLHARLVRYTRQLPQVTCKRCLQTRLCRAPH